MFPLSKYWSALRHEIMANYGFRIDDALKQKPVELICQTLHGAHRAKITDKEEHDTKPIAEAHVHRECTTGSIKNFRILSDVPF